MADIPQVITNYDALVGVAIGAGLTYGFSALNRRHQEARENETRWYEERFRAYVELNRAVTNMTNLLKQRPPAKEECQRATDAYELASAAVRLVGSPKAAEESDALYRVALRLLNDAQQGRHIFWSDWNGPVRAIQDLARKDLGHPSP
jgi:hypothetical protein